MKKKIIIILSSCLASAVLFIMGILIYIYCLFPPRKIEASLTDMALEVEDNDYIDGFIYVYKYEDIESVEYKATIYNNEVIHDFNFPDSEVGIYYNDIYGRYESYVSKKSKHSVVILLKKNTYVVIGLEKDKDTLSLYNGLLEYLDKS